jgi:hypothetical protein
LPSVSTLCSRNAHKARELGNGLLARLDACRDLIRLAPAQLSAIADGIVGGLRDERTKPIGREGTAASHWILVDFGSVIIHIFTPPEREYYGLEKHWSEARTILSVQ